MHPAVVVWRRVEFPPSSSCRPTCAANNSVGRSREHDRQSFSYTFPPETVSAHQCHHTVSIPVSQVLMWLLCMKSLELGSQALGRQTHALHPGPFTSNRSWILHNVSRVSLYCLLICPARFALVFYSSNMDQRGASPCCIDESANRFVAPRTDVQEDKLSFLEPSLRWH